MKVSYLAIFLFVLKSFCFQAQLPDQSIAPDFTVTDVQGNTHHLYAYLNQGKTVVLNFATTWCTPCWDYQQSNVLNNLFETYGPDGSNEMVILFIESDPTTTQEDLEGSGLSTLGNWVLDQKYPIINDIQHPSDPYKTTTAALYDVNFIPTIYIIGPNRMLFEDHWQDGFLNQHGLHDFVDDFNVATFDKDVAAFNYSGHNHDCHGSLTPQIRIQNLGLGNNLQSAIITTKHNGEIVQVDSWLGNLSLYETALVDLSLLQNMMNNCTLTFEVTTENDQNNDNGILEKTITSIDNIAKENLILRIVTDEYPEDISWTIKDYNHQIVAQGENYSNTLLIEENITLPDLENCYYFTINDAYGDGLGVGNIMLINEIDQSVVFEIVGNSYLNTKIEHFTTELTPQTAVFDNIEAVLKIYPNPAEDVIFVDLTGFSHGEYSVKIVNILGQKVHSSKVNGGEITTINANNFASGVYQVVMEGQLLKKIELIVKP
jgi:thiol-disulfide isomerase/thioredoxin